MKKKEIIKSLLREFHFIPLPEYTPREISIPLDLDKIITLIGVRRSGKTYILYQVIDQLLKEHDKNQIVFLNFEDERLDLVVDDLDLVLQAYQELYPDNDLSACYFFFDEIQNVTGWEKFIRRVYDTVSKHIFLTGSNSKLLSSEIATSLRGRSISYEVFPLNFREFLKFQNIAFDLYVPEIKGRIYHALESYCEKGGFPELVKISDETVRHRILQEYFDVMLFRDLIERYEIKNTVALKFFIKRLFSCATKQVSIHRIYNDLKSSGIKIGKNSLYGFLEQAESIFLVQTLRKYSPKLSVQEFGEKKIYAIDNGLLNSLIFKFSEDKGKAMEQIVFWELRRRGNQIFFLKNGYECDFVTVAKFGEITNIIQVCNDLSDTRTKAREVKGITMACKYLGISQGTIITYDEHDVIQESGTTVNIVPLPVYLCS